MRYEELRIGNWVNNEDCILLPWQWSAEDFLSEREVEGVPLDKEWLLNFGFEWRDGFLLKELQHARLALGFAGGAPDKMSIFQYTIPGKAYEPPAIVNFGSNFPEHVHQLQNLWFALTGGEELLLHQA